MSHAHYNFSVKMMSGELLHIEIQEFDTFCLEDVYEAVYDRLPVEIRDITDRFQLRLFSLSSQGDEKDELISDSGILMKEIKDGEMIGLFIIEGSALNVHFNPRYSWEEYYDIDRNKYKLLSFSSFYQSTAEYSKEKSWTFLVFMREMTRHEEDGPYFILPNNVEIYEGVGRSVTERLVILDPDYSSTDKMCTYLPSLIKSLPFYEEIPEHLRYQLIDEWEYKFVRWLDNYSQ